MRKKFPATIVFLRSLAVGTRYNAARKFYREGGQL